MNNYLFFTKEGFTYDKSNNQTNNMQILGDTFGNDIYEAFSNFKDNHSYLLKHSYKNVLAIQTTGDVIMNLEL